MVNIFKCLLVLTREQILIVYFGRKNACFTLVVVKCLLFANVSRKCFPVFWNSVVAMRLTMVFSEL